MKRFPLSACCAAALCLVVYLVPTSTAALLKTGAGGADSPRVEAYRANLLTPYEERIVGQRLAYIYEQQHTLLKDSLTQARLNRIKAELSIIIPAPALKISVIQSARPEAVSFPPSNIYITSALIRLAATDDELAAVIAHEAAHVKCHHLAHLIALVQTLPAAERESFPSSAAIITGQSLRFDFPTALDDARLRSEMEADQLAVLWLGQAGYRIEALPALLDRLANNLAPRAQKERAALQARSRSLTVQIIQTVKIESAGQGVK